MLSVAALQEVTVSTVWMLNAFAVAFVVVTYFACRGSQNRGRWALLGGVLLVVAGGNAVLLENVRISTAGAPAALFGMLVFAPLGSTFVANWLTRPLEPSKAPEDKKAKQEMILARAKMAQSQSDMSANTINSSAD